MSSIKPILFNTEMTIAVEKNRKTQTRRLVRFSSGRIEGKIPDPDRIHLEHVSGEHAFFKIEPFYRVRIKSPYKVGDILYVRETWSTKLSNECYAQPCHTGRCPYESCESAPGPCFPEEYIYKATDNLPSYGGKWHPSIHMPKEAARIFLRVTDVRVERLQEITIEGTLSEGLSREAIERKIAPGSSCPRWVYHEAAKRLFSELWDSTVEPAKRQLYGWAANPWVWVYSFERCEKPEEWK